MLSGLCFLGVNSILTIIIKGIIKNGGIIDNLFLSALVLTATGNLLLLGIGDVLAYINAVLSTINALTSLFYMFYYKK